MKRVRLPISLILSLETPRPPVPFWFELTGILSYAPSVLMIHRHLNHKRFTPAAIDDVIGRGKRKDWLELGRAARTKPPLFRDILRVCEAHCADPHEQRYHFWRLHARQGLARMG